MENWWRNIFLMIFFTALFSCKKPLEPILKFDSPKSETPDSSLAKTSDSPLAEITYSSWAETENAIRSIYDNMTVFTWQQYNELLKKLSQDKFIVLPLNEMRNHYDTSKVVVGLRHDVDNNPFKALEMATIEKHFGIRSTYFILATAKYYGHFSNSGIIRNHGMDSLYRKLYETGAEIGIHNDLLAVMILDRIDPFFLIKMNCHFINH